MFHVFCFDGTQNGLDDQFPTNIRLISELANMPDRQVHYFEGPGNDERNIFQHLVGSLFGADMWSIRDEAVNVLFKVFQSGDKIAVFGFSRGAAIARMFCHDIARKGFTVEFLGCFDTVFAVLPFGPSQQGLFTDLTVSGLVMTARHAVALNEDRQAFAPNLMNLRPGVSEMWFKGNHADVGGGYEQRGLADIALNWMLSEARTEASLNFRPLSRAHPTLTVHRESLPALRETRTPVVLVDGEASEIPPQIYTA